MGQRRSLAESRPIPGNSREDSGEEGNPRVLVLYQEEGGGQRRSLAESRPIPGNSRWCSAWLNPREEGGVLSYTSGQQAEVVLFEVLRLYQGSVWSAYTRSNQDSVYTRSLPRCWLYQVTSKILFIPGGVPLLTSAADTRLSSDSDGVCVTAFVKRVSGAMTLVGAGWYHQSPRLGGWARRSKAAASGRAASITTRVSGRWARGSSGYTTPGLSLLASPASRVGQVI